LNVNDLLEPAGPHNKKESALTQIPPLGLYGSRPAAHKEWCAQPFHTTHKATTLVAPPSSKRCSRWTATPMSTRMVLVDPQGIGLRIRRRRQALGLTLKEAARRAGMNAGTLSSVELYYVNRTPLRLPDIARALETTVRQLTDPRSA
jgi:hypothetical protein